MITKTKLDTLRRACVEVNKALDLLFPRFCPTCGTRLSAKEDVCTQCKMKIEGIPYKERGNAYYQWLFHRGKYSGEVGKLVKIYKFVPRPSLSEFLATLLYEVMERFPPPKNSVLTYVPPTFSSLKQKGFNHTKKLCKALSKKCALPCLELIEVKHESGPQVGKSAAVRKKNVEGKYEANLKELYKTSGMILLVDDVFTTGATVGECSKVLKRAGAQEVWVYTLAKA